MKNVKFTCEQLKKISLKNFLLNSRKPTITIANKIHLKVEDSDMIMTFVCKKANLNELWPNKAYYEIYWVKFKKLLLHWKHISFSLVYL